MPRRNSLDWTMNICRDARKKKKEYNKLAHCVIYTGVFLTLALVCADQYTPKNFMGDFDKPVKIATKVDKHVIKEEWATSFMSALKETVLDGADDVALEMRKKESEEIENLLKSYFRNSKRKA